MVARYSADVLADEKLLSRLDLFQSKAHFSRTVSFALLIMGVVLISAGVFKGKTDIAGYGLTGLLCGVQLFYRFLKFWRQYSFELLSYYGQTGEVSSAFAAKPSQ